MIRDDQFDLLLPAKRKTVDSDEFDIQMFRVEVLLKFINMRWIPEQDKSIVHIPDVFYWFEFFRTVK